MLKEIGRRTLESAGESVLRAEDFMDDGSRINLTISIDVEAGQAVFDFSGSSPEFYGNINAPKAVVLSALIYSLRCLVGQDIPLNQVWCKRVQNNAKSVRSAGSAVDRYC